jgi:hypothetical protein
MKTLLHLSRNNEILPAQGQGCSGLAYFYQLSFKQMMALYF